MKGKYVLITGSTDGLGKQAALELAVQGAQILLHGRNQEKGEKVREEISKKSGNHKIDFLCADFASLKNVRSLAQEIEERYPRLDVLIHNAGVFMKKRHVTEDGLEMTFAVNHMAPFFLNHLLFDLLKKSAPARVVVVSSIAHKSAEFSFENLESSEPYSAYQAYALSKYCNILFTYALARRCQAQETGITANALHPGVIDTKMLRDGFSSRGKSVREGVKTHVYLASSPEMEGVNGKYFEEGEEARSEAGTYNTDRQERLWQISESFVFPGVKVDF